MSDAGLAAARKAMTDAGVNPTAIEVFSRHYRQVESGQTGVVPEDSIEPLTMVPSADDLVTEPDAEDRAMGRLVVIKLNGGLGTSMGLERAKTLIQVRQGLSFLDIIVRQVRAARRAHHARLPLLLMDSFRTSRDSLAALSRYDDLPVERLPLDFLQSREPKLRADDLTPVSWPADPELEWCPPGHGDLYPSLLSCGVLDRLLDAGFRYAFVSNGDNLGATPDATLAAWFAGTGAPCAVEVCRRTVNDKKGGHLAVRRSDGHLVLRDSAQTAEADQQYFTDELRHPFFNTNNMWFDLSLIREALAERDGVLGLPLIRNQKPVDPRDPSSPQVIQIESAMGSAIEVFDGARAILVGRERFLPVKTTNELALLRSDLYELSDDGRLVPTTDRHPEISLDPQHYRRVDDFEARIGSPLGLREATALSVRGDVTFGAGVRIVGTVHIDTSEPLTLVDGSVLGE